MTAASEVLLDRISSVVRTRLPVGITPAYLDGFLYRHRRTLVAILDHHLGGRASANDDALPPEEWTAAKRTRANLEAMRVAASKHPEDMTDADRRVLAGYSGWGGLSIESASPHFPAGFPVPEERGLIHEYYTPTKVAAEVARVVKPLLPGLASLPGAGGRVLALEPSAGIGRFVRALSGPGFDAVEWLAVEYSELSSRMLSAIRSDLALYVGPFERWVREHAAEYEGRVQLVVSNPPYGQRGAAVAEDPDRVYREKQAYAYFMRRGLDLLAPGGLGVYLVPYGFLTGRAERNVALREKVLRRHHLAAAYRLPSKLFPGALLVTDLLFFRSRGGTLTEVAEEDRSILEGRYFDEHPEHVLGREVGRDAGDDDQTSKPRFGYQVEGEFTRLPDLVERPMCGACVLAPVEVPRTVRGGRVGVARHVQADTEGLPEELASAVHLGLRVDAFLAALAAEDSEEPSLLWPELHEALLAWSRAHGNPWAKVDLQRLAGQGVTGAERFLSAFQRSGKLIASLETKPVYRPRYRGRPDDVVAQAAMLYRQARTLPVDRLLAFHRKAGGTMEPDAAVAAVLASGWCRDGDAWDQLVPGEHYYTGHLWPRYDRARARADGGDETAAAQARRLLQEIAPAVYDDIGGVSPRQGWIPLDLVEGWLSATLNQYYGPVHLVRDGGLVVPSGVEYAEIEEGSTDLGAETIWCIGWINHDKTVFSPKKKKDENIDEVRLQKAAEWDQSFRAWIGADEGRRARVEEAYNRSFQGFKAPTYASEPLHIVRWAKEGPRLHPHQIAGARRVLANRGGLVAFDVGVGKTYTGIAVLARARQEGWCRRPVVLVPNSIVWKWEADIRRVLPDYRIAVIGSKRKVIARGERKGLVTSDTDTPQERAEKWTRFQGGEFDVVLLTYSALERTRMNEAAVRAYAEQTEAIQREVKLRQRNAMQMKTLTERQRAILKEGVSAWVAETMEIREGWEYDPGIAWDDIGIDLLIVDEAQNFKNLYLPEAREGGVPRFMGNAGEGSNRAWQLDFRCAAVRRRTGGAGVVQLSATPAKNSPLEFYNLIQYVDHDAWSRMGIRDPEQFIDRYLRIELKPVVNTKMEVEERSAVTGFQNLHELRETIFRYGEFKTAEDVGLKLPEPRVQVVEVDMDAAQDAKYDLYVAKIEQALSSTSLQDKSVILGLLARMALVAIHPNLDEGYDWKSAQSGDVNPHSPKFDALTRKVAANRTCGHIVFVDNVAAHAWVKAVLVEAGIPEGRIAVLNAVTAKAAADRQRIAREFNGAPEDGLAPLYDVVIANAIAYEGIDLQTRTCAIHHLDLPWEPATLQQRNGRGVRQGNTLQTIEINYYFARRSQDGLRFNLIQGKLGWMTELLQSQARDTNNPGAQMELGPEEILLLISRDPEKTARRLAEVRARREEEARKKVAADAARLLKSANARFRKAEGVDDPTEAARLRLEGEERLKDLAKVDPSAWPWAEWMYAVRDTDVLVPPDGQAPVYEGLRVGTPSPFNPDRVTYAEFGKVRGTEVAVREAGSASWSSQKVEQVAALGLRPEHLSPIWPEDDDARTEQAVVARIERDLRRWGNWPTLGWALASDAWVEKWWPRMAGRVVRSMAEASPYYVDDQKVPVVVGGKLTVGRGRGLLDGDVLPPNRAGWQEFLALAPASGLKFTELAEAGEYWWGRKLPRDVLAAARKTAGDAAHAEEAA
ncbi:SNF2-related protein [Myxococcota bacterium]|nr:SNF2-related protein [Myxococcota bacterium]